MDIKQMMHEQHFAIKRSLEHLTAAVDAYSATFEEHALSDNLATVSGISQCHVKMIDCVKQMQSAVYGPLNMIMLHFEESLRSSSLRALLELGVLDCLPSDGQEMSVAEMAVKLQADETLLVRLMRVVVPTFFSEPIPGVYTHTPNSMVYLDPACRANFKMMYDEICTASVKIPEFLKKNGYENPNSLINNPYTYAHDTKGLTMFEFLLEDPIRFKNFNDSMQAKSAQTLQPYNLFPFKDELSKIETVDDTILLVDVGGGNGQAATSIRELCVGIKGKIVLQDQPQVIEGITDLPTGIETMAHDFFKPQPIKGALLYYIHRCLHDWPESECITILKRIAAAMQSGTSRLLISEIVIPPGPTDVQTAWSDICMLTFSGMERSEQQWRALLEMSGLTLLKVHSGQGRSNHGILEAVLR